MQVNKIFSIFTVREFVSLILGAIALVVTLRLAPVYQDIAILKRDVNALEANDTSHTNALIRIEGKLDNLTFKCLEK